MHPLSQINQETPARLNIVAWPDPLTEAGGHKPGSPYVEAVWLCILGPSTTLCWQRLARLASARPATAIDTVDLAVSLGLDESLGRNAPISRTLGRMVVFGAAQREGDTLAVRVALPDVPDRITGRLSYTTRLATSTGPTTPAPRHCEHAGCVDGGSGMNGRHSPIEAARRRHRLADVAARTGIRLPSTSGAVTVRCPMPSHGHPDRTPSLRLYLDDGT